MTVEMEPAVEYSSHLAQWKAAFQQLASQQQPAGRVGAHVAQAGDTGVAATLPDGSANPYAAVLSGLQGLLEGPLFKAAQQPAAGDASTLDPDGQAAAVGEDEEEEYEEQAGEEVVQQAEQPSASAARSPPGSRRPRKRQAASSQDSQEAATAAVAAAAAATPGRPPAAKKRRNSSQAPTPQQQQAMPASASLADLANLAAAVAEEEESFDDPVLGDQEQQQDQGMLAAYQSGSLGGALSVQPENGGTTTGGRGARGGSRARQRTPAPSSSGADEGDSLGMSFPLVNEDGKPLTKQQIKRLRRQQSNRESARRSRQRKAEEANMLARRVGEMEVTCGALQTKNATLEAEVQQLRSIIDMMAGDSSALAAQVTELGGAVSAEIMANVNWLVAARGNWAANTPLQSAAGAEHAA